MKTIKQEKQSDIELHSYTPDHVTITQHDQFTSDEVVIEKSKIPEFVAAIHPDLEREKEDFAVGFKDWCDKQFIEVSKGEWVAKYPDHTDEQLIELYKNRDNEQ